MPLLAWIVEAEPDCEPLIFEAKLLQDDAVGLLIALQLTRHVAVASDANGGYEVRHFDDIEQPAGTLLRKAGAAERRKLLRGGAGEVRASRGAPTRSAPWTSCR